MTGIIVASWTEWATYAIIGLAILLVILNKSTPIVDRAVKRTEHLLTDDDPFPRCLPNRRHKR